MKSSPKLTAEFSAQMLAILKALNKDAVEVAPGTNDLLLGRLSAIRKSLMAGYEGGMQLSSATKGAEREVFVQALLTQVFSPAYRFGTGDITGTANQRSGQVDIVVESPYWYSLPTHQERPRLYMAEGVAAIIEVKSDLATQWSEVESTVAGVKRVQRRYRKHLYHEMAKSFESHIRWVENSSSHTDDRAPTRQEILEMLQKEAEKHDELRRDIPCYVVGFTGWKSATKLQDHFDALPGLDGALILDSSIACFRRPWCADAATIPYRGDWVLLMLLDFLSQDIADVTRAEIPQSGNYSMKFLIDFMANPVETFVKIAESLPAADD